MYKREIKAYDYFSSEEQWEAYIKDLLRNNDFAVYKAIILVYINHSRKLSAASIGEESEYEHLGFNRFDAMELSLLAAKIKVGYHLTEAELARSRNKMCKYWRQLMQASLKKIKQRKALEDREEELLKQAKEKEKSAVAEEF